MLSPNLSARYVCLLLAICSNAACAQHEDCNVFVVLDTYSSKTSSDVYQRVQDRFCLTQISDRGTAEKDAAKAGIPIPIAGDILNLDLNGNHSRDEWDKWKSEFCRSTYSEVQTKLRHSDLSVVFSDNATKAVLACLSSKLPLYGYFKVEDSGKAFKFSFTTAGHQQLRNSSVTASDGAITNCSFRDTADPFDMNDRSKDISGEDNEFSCDWDSSKTVKVAIQLRNLGKRTFTLDSIPARHVYKWVQDPEVQMKQMGFGKCSDPNGHQIVLCTRATLGQTIYTATDARVSYTPQYQGSEVTLEGEQEIARIKGWGACAKRTDTVPAHVYRCTDVTPQ